MPLVVGSSMTVPPGVADPARLDAFVRAELIRRLFGVRMRDINFAFKLLRRRVFEHITLVSEGSFIDAELIIRARKLGYHVIQFGVDYFPRTRGVSTLSSPAIIIKILREMRELRRELLDITPVV